MLAFSVENLSYEIGVDVILRGVSFAVNEGERVGIVGVNGAGKSTLLKIIAGELPPSDGSVRLKKGARVAMLHQNESVSGENTPYEELLLSRPDLVEDEKTLEELSEGMAAGDEDAARRYHALHERFLENGGYEYKGRIRGMLRSLGFTEDLMSVRVSALSGGQKTRLALARILYEAPDILLLDEPTNHLDLDTLSWLEDCLRSYRKTVLVVSHDRYFLDRTVGKILDIEHGGAKLYNGNYSVFTEKKKNDREIAERHYKNQQKEIARIEAYIAQQKRWNRERNIIAAESRQKALDRMEKLERPQNAPREIRMSFRAGLPSGEDVLTVRGLEKAYGAKSLFKNLSFEVKKGDRLMIIGHNGCGKSTLMKILMHRVEPGGGVFSYGYNVTVGYYDQENQNLRPDNTVLDELWNTDLSAAQTDIRTALGRFDFTGDDVMKKVAVLSGGERARLTFSKLILRENNLLLLDEPTNHLDLRSKEVLEDALEDYDGTLICVSHDRYFIGKLATRILDFDGPEGKCFLYEGSYEEYRRFRSDIEEGGNAPEERASGKQSENKRAYLESKKAASELRKTAGALSRAEERAAAAEKRLDELSLLEKENASDYMALSGILREREELEDELLGLYERIEELKAALDEASSGA